MYKRKIMLNISVEEFTNYLNKNWLGKNTESNDDGL